MLFISIFLYLIPKAQIVKFIKNPLLAKYRVFISSNPIESSHWIYRVKSPSEITKGGEWFVVNNPQLFSNATLLYKVDKIDDADIIVFYVSNKDSARINIK
jgi:hypothetical protein